MRLAKDSIDRLYSAGRNHEFFLKSFAKFAEAAETLNDTRDSPIRSLTTVTTDNDGTSFSVTALSVTLEFRFLFQLTAAGKPKGTVVCLLDKPRIDMTVPVVLGSFGFEAHGTTDLERVEGEDPIEMHWAGAPVALHFLDMALSRNPLPAEPQ